MSRSEVRVVIPEPHYTLFNGQRSGLPEVIVVNDALLRFADIEVFPWHLRVEMEAKDLIENGMPSPAESELLFSIGDQIESVVLTGTTEQGSPNAVFLARSTWNEIRELMFQVHDPEVAHSALQALLNRHKWERSWSYKMFEDRTWSNAAHVFKLFPLAKGHDA
jgi:hypothetical protein